MNKILDVEKLCKLLEISKIESRKLMKNLNAKKISNKYFITFNMLTDYLESKDISTEEKKSFIQPNI